MVLVRYAGRDVNRNTNQEGVSRMGTKKTVACVALAVAVGMPSAAIAQEAMAISDAQKKVLSKRAAEADAYRKLAETINGLRITSETYVKDFVTESDTIRSELDTFVRGVRLGDAKWDADLACMVEAEVTVAKVIEHLKSIHGRHYKGHTIQASDFEQITRYVQKKVIKAVGMGAPRPDLPPDIPGGEIPATTHLPEPMIPALWRSIGPQARLGAYRAACVDAQRRLVERIKGLRLTSDTLVRDFVAESDVITTTAKATLTGAYEVEKPYYHDNELIVEVTYEVPVESVITTIKSLHKRLYKGNRVTGMDIEKVTRQLKTRKFRAVGMGVPKPQYVKIAAAKTETRVPEWAGQVITATGQGVPPADKTGTPQGKLMAARAAELAAKRALAERVKGFSIDSNTVVRDFVTEHDEINSQLDAVIYDAYVRSTTYDSEGTATVVVEMPAMRAWEIVNTYVRIKRF